MQKLLLNPWDFLCLFCGVGLSNETSITCGGFLVCFVLTLQFWVLTALVFQM